MTTVSADAKWFFCLLETTAYMWLNALLSYFIAVIKPWTSKIFVFIQDFYSWLENLKIHLWDKVNKLSCITLNCKIQNILAKLIGCDPVILIRDTFLWYFPSTKIANKLDHFVIIYGLLLGVEQLLKSLLTLLSITSFSILRIHDRFITTRLFLAFWSYLDNSFGRRYRFLTWGLFSIQLLSPMWSYARNSLPTRPRHMSFITNLSPFTYDDTLWCRQRSSTEGSLIHELTFVVDILSWQDLIPFSIIWYCSTISPRVVKSFFSDILENRDLWLFLDVFLKRIQFIHEEIFIFLFFFWIPLCKWWL